MASAVLLGLDGPGMVRALGIAGTQASGLMEWRKDGSWIKRLHPGRARGTRWGNEGGGTEPVPLSGGAVRASGSWGHTLEGPILLFECTDPGYCDGSNTGTWNAASGAGIAGFDAHPQPLPRAEEMLLAGDVVEGARAHAGGQGVAAGGGFGDGGLRPPGVAPRRHARDAAEAIAFLILVAAVYLFGQIIALLLSRTASLQSESSVHSS